MRSKSPCVLAFVGFFLLSVAPLNASHRLQNETWTEAEWQWLNENFHLVLDRSLPLEKGSSVIASYRTYETLQVGAAEYSFAIFERRGNGRSMLTAHIRVPDGHPIGQQLLLFHRKHPLSSIQEAENALTFKDWDLSEKQCLSVSTSLQNLGQIRFGLPMRSVKVYLDPSVHEFHLNSSIGNVDAALVDFENSLVQWGIDTRRAIQACIADFPAPMSESAPRK